MLKKEKIRIIRSTDFESVDEELGAAMARLDAANVRVAGLLDTEKRTEEGAPEGDAVAQPGAEAEATAGTPPEPARESS